MISLAGTHLINKYGGPSLSMCPVQAIHKAYSKLQVGEVTSKWNTRRQMLLLWSRKITFTRTVVYECNLTGDQSSRYRS